MKSNFEFNWVGESVIGFALVKFIKGKVMRIESDNQIRVINEEGRYIIFLPYDEPYYKR